MRHGLGDWCFEGSCFCRDDIAGMFLFEMIILCQSTSDIGAFGTSTSFCGTWLWSPKNVFMMWSEPHFPETPLKNYPDRPIFYPIFGQCFQGGEFNFSCVKRWGSVQKGTRRGASMVTLDHPWDSGVEGFHLQPSSPSEVGDWCFLIGWLD